MAATEDTPMGSVNMSGQCYRELEQVMHSGDGISARSALGQRFSRMKGVRHSR